jgi:hypothetical protein
MNYVPFAPTFSWTMSPFGWLIAGASNRYAIDQYLPDGKVLRIERQAEPVPVGAAEKADAEARATGNMRQSLPTWRWNGPPIPDRKPAFNAFFAGLDGRIWVLRPAPGEPIPVDQLDKPRDVGNGVVVPPQRFREPVVFDVFEPDGRFLGTVRAPDGFSQWPRPVARGDFLWGIVRDALGVNTIRRLWIRPLAR